MAKNEKRIAVTLACEQCKRRNYITHKNKINDRERIEMKVLPLGPRPHGAQGNPLKRVSPTTGLHTRRVESTLSKNKKNAKGQASAAGGTPYLKRPLAPAPWPVFVATVVAAVLLLMGASKIHNDYIAAFGCVAVLALAAVIFDFTGRRRATLHPNPIYTSEHLPQSDPKFKYVLVALTGVSLISVVGHNVQPGHHSSALPYFLAVGFLFVVMPQALAYRALADARRSPAKAAKASRTSKKLKKRH